MFRAAFCAVTCVVYANVNLVGKNIYYKENRSSVRPDKPLDANKEVGLELSTEKTKYMSMSHDKCTGQNYYIKVVNKFLKVWQSIFDNTGDRSKLHLQRN
jgi:hypothetical protein